MCPWPSWSSEERCAVTCGHPMKRMAARWAGAAVKRGASPPPPSVRARLDRQQVIRGLWALLERRAAAPRGGRPRRGAGTATPSRCRRDRRRTGTGGQWGCRRMRTLQSAAPDRSPVCRAAARWRASAAHSAQSCTAGGSGSGTPRRGGSSIVISRRLTGPSPACAPQGPSPAAPAGQGMPRGWRCTSGSDGCADRRCGGPPRGRTRCSRAATSVCRPGTGARRGRALSRQ
jgi:hypothetical protein